MYVFIYNIYVLSVLWTYWISRWCIEIYFTVAILKERRDVKRKLNTIDVILQSKAETSAEPFTAKSCPVCFDDFPVESEKIKYYSEFSELAFRVFECGHKFCAKCVSKRCPICVSYVPKGRCVDNNTLYFLYVFIRVYHVN